MQQTIPLPWQLVRASLVPLARTYPVPRQRTDDAGPRTYSEEDLHAYAQQQRMRETEPPFIPEFAEGTWCVDCLDGLWQLRRHQLTQLIFPGGDPFAREWGWFSDIQPWLVEKYYGWMQQGHTPPPLRAFETIGRHIKVTNGHNRAAALIRAGRCETLVWVSVAYHSPVGSLTDLTHALAVELALQTGEPVPPEVLVDYPHLMKQYAASLVA